MFAAVALIAMIALPSMAFGVLTNEFGMTFAGQAKCLECHDGVYGQTVHGRFAKPGLIPAPPSGWTDFRAAGTPPVVGAENLNSGLPWFSSGGSYRVNLNWITLGDFAGGAPTEYLFFNGNTSANTKGSPWNVVEGLSAAPTAGASLPINEGDYTVGSEDPAKGLFDVVYGCHRCHQLGTTTNTANATATAVVPNPTVSIPATFTTAAQWARDAGKTAADFRTDPTVSEPGMSIQCEACHGTGFQSTANTTKHWNSGTQLSHRIPTGTVAPSGTLPGTTVSTLGQSQVCGQCHGSYTNVTGTLGIYGFTPNLPLRNFADISGVSGGASYTYTPTEAEFMASPTKYWLFPNGSNAKGSHFYYNEWATSGHAYRGALGTTGSPDILPGGTHGHYNAKSSSLDCAKCHTGEGYLKSKNAAIMKDFTPTNSNVGYMGQECITCHNSHPAGVGLASNIRTGDAAGVRSNTGRVTKNNSVCEDCHNWQVEVLGAPIALGASRVSHPQREVLAGRGMYDVPEAKPFMPGAKCEECHMPKTNKAANRFSHGMHIMMPGKAELWNTAAGKSYLGEDSCSGCHAGENRTQLQANIDAWQSQTTTLITEALAQNTAAKARAAAAGTDLDERATTLVSFVKGDSSNGVHNPPYVKAGLEKAIYFSKAVGATFSNVIASKSIAVGHVGSFGGKLLDGNGAALAAESVMIQQAPVGTSSWTTYGTVTTNDLGEFAAMVAPSSSMQFRAVWTPRAGSTQTMSNAATVTVITTKTASSTTIRSSAATIRYGKTVTLSGVVSPNASGQLVTIQRRINTGSWAKLTTASINSSSAYTRTISRMTRGAWQFRAYYAGTSSVAASYSPPLRVIVK